MRTKEKTYNLPLTFTLFILLGIWTATIILGNELVLAENWKCFSSIGCNYGFFGYDTMVQHFLAGVLGAVVLVWFFRTYPRLSLLRSNFLKNFLIVVAVVGLVGICWEVSEYIHDIILIRASGIENARASISNYLSQASSADTIGDLVFDLLGGAIGVLLLKAINRKNI